MKQQRVVARRKSDGLYVHIEGPWCSETEHVESISRAKDFGSAKEVMVKMGCDNYKKYEAVNVSVEYKEGKAIKFPKESEIWEDE